MFVQHYTGTLFTQIAFRIVRRRRFHTLLFSGIGKSFRSSPGTRSRSRSRSRVAAPHRHHSAKKKKLKQKPPHTFD
ncbi:uncharacterized protein Dsimw501_GD28297 [Drosophila simulans]|uniref:Uncharacterized protein n=1 Tax=Drosophila simulans TaxID=7240 RepID=A0A0J9TIX7_DROSI|nr:uncharacterized protein Dsimw501_GD28297 [Drosophila simulans]